MKKLVICLLVTISLSSFAFAQDYRVHKVKPGETVASIAKKYNVSETAIYKLNPDAKKERITATVLVIPSGEILDGVAGSSVVNFKNYHVKEKETLYSLAKENNITVEDLKKYNTYLYDEELGKGDVIRIPIFSTEKVVNFNESLQTSSFKNLVHIVLPKEGKYRIAKKYEMTIEELEKMNPLMGVLQPGQILRVANPNAGNKNLEGGNFDFYEVQPKETYYSLTRRFEISKDSLVALNPILEAEGLLAGMTLRIPKKGSKSLDEATLLDREKLNLKEYISHRSAKNVVVMLPFNLQKFAGDSIDKRDVLKSDRILQISLDFHSGVMAAIDSIQKMGIPVNLQVFDTEQNTKKTSEIFNNNSFDNVQLFIGPLLSSNVEEASKRLANKKVALLSPLTNSSINGNQYFFQTRPTREVLENLMISYIDSLKAGKNIVILAGKKQQALKNKLVSKFPNAKVVVQSKAEYLQQKDLTSLLEKDKENWVIIETDDYGVISNATSYLNALLPNYNGKIRLFTSDKSEPFEEEVSNQYLSNLHFTYASIAKESNLELHNGFVKTYQKSYGILPSKFAVRGFDLTLDALLRLASDDDVIKSTRRKGTTEYVENKFNYLKKGEKGYYNTAAYLIEYQEGLKLKVLNE